MDISSPESERPPPPGFPPFVFLEDDGGINADEICAHFGGYVAETCQQMATGLPDIPEETEAPELVVPGQWCDARTDTDACVPSDNGTGYG